MSGPEDVPGHGPADPRGYLIAEVAAGFVWIRRADDHVSAPHPTHEAAVASAEADRRSRTPEP